MVTTGELIKGIWNEYLSASENSSDIRSLIAYGRNRGWLCEQDLSWCDYEVDRRSAARIIHEFLRVECGQADVRDWNKAKKLKDLYDCRACTKHVAWVYEKGIMEAKEEDRFMLLHKVSEEEFGEILLRMKKFMTDGD